MKTLKLITSSLLLSATVVACFTFMGCAGMERVQTASGMPEVTINAKPDRIKVELMGVMANNGYALMRDTEYSVGFSKTMDPGQELLTRVALGSSYSSQPKMLVEVPAHSAGKHDASNQPYSDRHAEPFRRPARHVAR